MRLLVIFFLIFAACERNPPTKTTVFSGNVMTINYRIVIGSTLTPEQTVEVETIISQTFHEINTTYNKWNPDSELSTLNNLGENQTVKLSPPLYQFLQLTDKVVKLSGGRFDPTIETVQTLWKNSLQKGQFPNESEIAALSNAVGWNKIHFEGGIFSKDFQATQLDLGGIAKGYAVDLLVENLASQGHSSIYVEWGGEIRTHGKHPQNRPWKVFISRLDDTNPNHAIAFVEMTNESLATSGDYLQKWSVAGDEYFHVIDATTLKPLKITKNSISSASVSTKECAVADALATAALTFATEDEAAEWLESIKIEYPELRYWLLTKNLLH